MVNISNKQRFPRTLSNRDFGLTADVTLKQYEYIKVGSLTVPAQQYIAWGANDILSGQPQGRTAYMRLDDTAGQLTGVFRLVVTDANETRSVVVLEERSEKMSADVNDRQKAVLLPEARPLAQEDSKLLILFSADATGKTVDFDDADTSIKLPVTVYQ